MMMGFFSSPTLLFVSLREVVILVVYFLEAGQPSNRGTSSNTSDKINILYLGTSLFIINLFCSLQSQSRAFFYSINVAKWLFKVVNRMQELAPFPIWAVAFCVELGASLCFEIAGQMSLLL